MHPLFRGVARSTSTRPGGCPFLRVATRWTNRSPYGSCFRSVAIAPQRKLLPQRRNGVLRGTRVHFRCFGSVRFGKEDRLRPLRFLRGQSRKWMGGRGVATTRRGMHPGRASVERRNQDLRYPRNRSEIDLRTRQSALVRTLCADDTQERAKVKIRERRKIVLNGLLLKLMPEIGSKEVVTFGNHVMQDEETVGLW
jgi:hypothetical protein